MQVWNDQQMQTNCNCRSATSSSKRLQPFIGAPQLTTPCSELTSQRSTIFNCFNYIKSKSHPQKLQKIQKYTRVATLFGVFLLVRDFLFIHAVPKCSPHVSSFKNKTYACASHLLCNKEILFDPNNITDHHGTAKGLKILSPDSVETSRKQGNFALDAP